MLGTFAKSDVVRRKLDKLACSIEVFRRAVILDLGKELRHRHGNGIQKRLQRRDGRAAFILFNQRNRAIGKPGTPREIPLREFLRFPHRFQPATNIQPPSPFIQHLLEILNIQNPVQSTLNYLNKNQRLSRT